MTIQEAIKSGKPFRRPSEVDWFPVSISYYPLSALDILADDWEIKQEPREIFLYFDLDTGRWAEAKNPKCHQEVIKVREVI